MPLQNRVTPYGEIIVTPERGTMLGNRGVLHNDHQQLVRTSQVRRWLVCVLEFKGIRRTIMKPGSYTELFFLDEATALSAGHRPCCECRRIAYTQFQNYWRLAVSKQASADAIDRRLQFDRCVRGGAKKQYSSNIDKLPDGCFVNYKNGAWLLFENRIYLWSPGGYVKSLNRPTRQFVKVLTPVSAVKVLLAGYTPIFHDSLKGA